jgi:glycerol kinase
MKDIILSIDQGTTGTTVVLVDKKLRILEKCNREFRQYYPKLGWVEHSPEEIWKCTVRCIQDALRAADVDPDRIAGIGITNQRETSVVWNKQSGKSAHRAIVWQDRRTTSYCATLKKQGKEAEIRRKTGLLLDPYFSASKLNWLLTNVRGLREKAKKGDVLFGTIDSYLVFKLTRGAAHVTDASNACRTMLMNLKTLAWDAALLKTFQVPKAMLPEIRSCSEVYGTTRGVPGLPDGIPVCGMAGDQQAALFGQACFAPGEAKCTYGTGSFLLMNTGNKPVVSKTRMLTSVGWKLNGTTTYVLEGSCFIAGAAVQWLRDGLQMIKKSPDVEGLAKKVTDSGGVIFVPALVGLGAPHWRPEARGLLTGLERGTTTAHLGRAVLEGIAFSQTDILGAMEKDAGRKLSTLKVDGGASANNLLMQFQSDVLGRKLVRPKMVETTALGAAFLAGLAIGIWKSQAEIAKAWKKDKEFKPRMKASERKKRLETWRSAVAKA